MPRTVWHGKQPLGTTLRRALLVAGRLAREPMTSTQVARMVGLAQPNAHAIIMLLVELGLVRVDRTDAGRGKAKYYYAIPGLTLADIGRNIESDHTLKSAILRPNTRDLTQ